MVEGDGFEPSKLKATDLQSAPFGHSGTPPGNVCLRTTSTLYYKIWTLSRKILIREGKVSYHSWPAAQTGMI